MAPPLLAERHDLAAVRVRLLPTANWRRYPAARDRAAWEQIPAATRAALIATGEERAAEDWEHLKATLILDYARKGDRRSYQDPHFRRRTRLHDLVLAECAEGRGRFLDAIADNLWLTCEESYWGWPAHLEIQAAGAGLPDCHEPTVDLGVGETAGHLAWTIHLLGEELAAISPQLLPRIQHEVNHRLLTPCLERDDFWWMGWHIGRHAVNNWNPWVNSNWLAAVLVFEADPERRVAAVHKIMRSLDVFIAHQPADGGCDEGPGYWDRAGGSLFDCLELLHSASGGAIDLFREPLIAETGRFIMRAHLIGDWYVNFADATARPTITAPLVQRYGRAIGDPALIAFGRWAEAHQADRKIAMIRSLNRTLAALLDPVPPAGRLTAPPADVWLPDLQFTVMRGRRFIVAAKGGHNLESHNHNDVGSFLACLDGSPLFIDVGVETYTAKTFSPRRYEIWTMQSQWHSLPTINGAMQMNGRAFAARNAAFSADETSATLTVDLAGAYPEAAAAQRWTRTLRLDREGQFTLADDFELTKATEPVTWNFMFHRRPELAAGGQVHLTATAGAKATFAYDANALDAVVDEYVITDASLKLVWGEHVYRLRLIAKATANTGRQEFVVTAD
ncbi:MAG: hypothetical protein RIS54_761 [Verrucomicrobiota bacterium]|jgi:hypothetical protein